MSFYQSQTNLLPFAQPPRVRSLQMYRMARVDQFQIDSDRSAHGLHKDEVLALLQLPIQ